MISDNKEVVLEVENNLIIENDLINLIKKEINIDL